MLPFNEIGLVKKERERERAEMRKRSLVCFDENVKHQHLLAHEFFLAHVFSAPCSYQKEIASL